MSRVQITASPSRLTWLVATSSGLVLLVWWLAAAVLGGSGADEPAAASGERPSAAQRGLAPSPREQSASHGAQGADLGAMQAELLIAERALDAGPQVVPDAPVRERPDYVSPMEWLVLKGVSAQNADPERELTRMVHFLRFHKLLERWQALPAQSDASVRRSLAAGLLADLPRRVAHGDVSVNDARAWLPRLVAELEPDLSAREARLAAEMAHVAAAAQPSASR